MGMADKGRTMDYKIVLHPHSEKEGALYPQVIAAQLARASLELIKWCQREGLVQAQVMVGGERGYSAADIRRLANIRSLKEDLGLDLDAVAIVLRMRERMFELFRELEEMERAMVAREYQLLTEIQRLRRRIAEETDW
jgi:DNA-binding transcriptional MerR regulator